MLNAKRVPDPDTKLNSFISFEAFFAFASRINLYCTTRINKYMQKKMENII